VRRRWSLLILQWLAYVAAAIWLATAWQIVDNALGFRLYIGIDYTKILCLIKWYQKYHIKSACKEIMR
jgi:hypothetical protein